MGGGGLRGSTESAIVRFVLYTEQLKQKINCMYENEGKKKG